MATTTFFPDPNPEVTSVDGVVARNPAGESWATIRAGAGTTADPSGASNALAQIRGTTTADQYDYMVRGIFLFDTSALSDTAGINSATLEFVATAKEETITGQSISLDTVTPASNTDLVAADFNVANWGGVAQATAITITSVTADDATYTVMTLNSTGLGNISKTGITKFGTRIKSDLDNVAPTWASNANGAYVNINWSDTAGTNKDPKLVVVDDIASQRRRMLTGIGS